MHPNHFPDRGLDHQRVDHSQHGSARLAARSGNYGSYFLAAAKTGNRSPDNLEESRSSYLITTQHVTRQFGGHSTPLPDALANAPIMERGRLVLCPGQWMQYSPEAALDDGRVIARRLSIGTRFTSERGMASREIAFYS